MLKELKAEAMFYSKALCYVADFVSFVLVIKFYYLIPQLLTQYIHQSILLDIASLIGAWILAAFVLPYIGYYFIRSSYREGRK